MSAREKLIPADVLLRLVEGSYEALIEGVQALVEEFALQIYGTEEVTVRVQGTYANHAIVVSDVEGLPLVRVHFENNGGFLKFVKHEPILVESYDLANLPSFLKQESRRAVDLLLNGDIDAAVSRVSQLLPLMPPSENTEEVRSAVVARVRECVEAKKGWKQAITANPAKVESLLGAETYAQYRPRTAAWESLYASDDPEDGQYQETIRGEVRVLMSRLKSHSNSLQGVMETVAGAGSVPKGAEDVVRSFESLAQELDGSLAEVRSALGAALSCESVSALAESYDLALKSLYDFEIATAFVTVMGNRIAQVVTRSTQQ